MRDTPIEQLLGFDAAPDEPEATAASSAAKTETETPIFGVSDALAVINQTLEYAFPTLTVVGEVASFKINQNKWVFFDLKDDESSLGCFMSVHNLRLAIADGMQVAVVARPGLTKWGKFSLTVQSIRPVGEGNLKKSFDLLRAKLDKEGLFAAERKRALPDLPTRLGVISSLAAAGYGDFIKILDERFGGLQITVAGVQVQGTAAPEQIIAALRYFNELATPPEVVAILRGGGSADDLATFNDEPLVRAIAASRVPIITGIGHEIDVTLADLVADVRAATPSNAAQILVPDRREILGTTSHRLHSLANQFERRLSDAAADLDTATRQMATALDQMAADDATRLNHLSMILEQLNPRTILQRGYSIVRDEAGRVVRGAAKVGAKLTIENANKLIETEVKNVKSK
jgi:exodeoxyribonuclease VII large subunit